MFRVTRSLLSIAIVPLCLLAAAEPTEEVAITCDPDDGGLTLPDGFCASVFAEVGPARHLAISDAGDVFVALRGGRGGAGGGVIALRDSDADGKADVEERFGDIGGTGILLRDGYLYFAPDDRVLRYPIADGAMAPSGPAETIVSGLPASRNHRAKSLTFDSDGALYINIGAPSNACQRESRQAGSPGMDPCPQLERRSGIWRFDANRPGQVQADGSRFATGLRNVVALNTNPATGTIFGAVHGRDSLSELWPDHYTLAQRVEKPSEEFVAIHDGDDFGWPYCYHDPETGKKYLAPEYGGDGVEIGRCADAEAPLIGFPAHWAPNDLEFYTGSQFPPEYRGGAFVAFHGSWNRAPEPQAGYNVSFVPMSGDEVTGDWRVFANGFAGDTPGPREADHRPVGLAQAPDGSLFVADSKTGKIWKIMYRGPTG